MYIRAENLVTDAFHVVMPESFPDLPSGYFEVLCWLCDDSTEDGFRILMDDTALSSKGLVLFPDDATWRCDSCGHLVQSGDENTDAYLYVEG